MKPASIAARLGALHYVLALLAQSAAVAAVPAEFGTPGGPPPRQIDAVMQALSEPAYDLELMISYGTSKGGSAGHLALAVARAIPGDDLVYSANFYADRSRRHASGFYTSELMLAIPKREYLWGTTSSLGPTASFGLDFGEIYKRSVVGIRVAGVPPGEIQAVVDFFMRMNDDYRRRARNTEYHDREVRYDYLRLNCAKAIGAAFRYGAGYNNLEVSAAKLLSGRRIVAATNANIPVEMAMRLMQQWHARGYRMETVIYRKYAGSPYVDPSTDPPESFSRMPNRFPSVLSRDFRRADGEYEDPDNLFVIYLLQNLARYSVAIDEPTGELQIVHSKEPLPFAEAARLAAEAAELDSTSYRSRLPFTPRGTRVDAEDVK